MSWPFNVWTTCFSYLKIFANSWPSASNFKSLSQSLEHFFLTVGRNNFGNKITIPNLKKKQCSNLHWNKNISASPVVFPPHGPPVKTSFQTFFSWILFPFMISSWDLVSLIFIYQLTVKSDNISKENFVRVRCFEIKLYQRLELIIPEGLKEQKLSRLSTFIKSIVLK